uniref:Uncharacterized protein MANES_16G087200 n=2 Tax=Rhizophora mucronata TaxID=61149 RepID=A0A2P2KXS0_RHIMU
MLLPSPIINFDFPALPAAAKEGMNNLSPGPNMPLGRKLHVKRPLVPLALIISASPSALVAVYESRGLVGYGSDSSPLQIPCFPSKTTLAELV